MDGDQTARLVYLGLLLAALSGWFFAEFRGRMGQALRMALAWGFIVIGLMAGYGLWQDIRRDIKPEQTIVANRIEVPRASDGHYYLTLTIDGVPMRFMADTGASNVVLRQKDAQILGIDTSKLAYLGTATTANGTTRTARVSLNNVALGPVFDAKISASVNEGDLDVSLLGMDYLGRFKIEMNGNMMVLSR